MRMSGLGDDLHQRHAGAVEVDQAGLRRRRVASCSELAGVLFEVDARDADAARASPRLDVEASRPRPSGWSYWLIW